MEIERKFTIRKLPDQLERYPFHMIEQAYLNTNPVIRIRRQDEEYYLTYKGKGFLAREEYNLPLNKESYDHLKKKADGNIISKKRILIPLSSPKFKACSETKHGALPEALTIELDIFEQPFDPMIIAEVEFDSEEAAQLFLAPDWFLEDVTYDSQYHNSTLSQKKLG